MRAIKAFDPERITNAQAILDAYESATWDDDEVLDCTYGHGAFWTLWTPRHLTGTDIGPAKSAVGYSVDFRAQPWPDARFDVVVLDPNYKLSGSTEAHPFGLEERYGIVDQNYKLVPELYAKGIPECIRVMKPKGRLLVKSMDQVSSGKKHWQTHDVVSHAAPFGLRLIDELHVFGEREQQGRQLHASSNYSTLSILGRGYHRGRQ